MALTDEKVCELKQVIHEQLTKVDLQRHVTAILSEALGKGVDTLSETDIFQEIKSRGLLEDVLQALKCTRSLATAPEPASRVSIDPSKRYIYLQIFGGKSFLEFLEVQQILPGHNAAVLVIHLYFRGQRFCSSPVPCSCEPDFRENFLFELHGNSAAPEESDLLSLADPVHFVLTKSSPTGETTLLSSYSLEWRTILGSESSAGNCEIQLCGIGKEAKVTVGVLAVKVELIPALIQPISADIVHMQLEMERKRVSEKEQLFLVYAKHWWQEYLQIRDTHSKRQIKIFAQDETATNRPVCCYVKPLQAGRLLDSPRQCARFVSLIPYEKNTTVGFDDAIEIWTSIHAFLARKKGDHENHSILLCSLLLGFGLDAYVCIGTKGNGTPHSWVLTNTPDGENVFWESLTGNRFLHQPIRVDEPGVVVPPQPSHTYRTIGCVFNHETFYANIQPSEAVEVCYFDLHNESRWKAMSKETLLSVSQPVHVSAISLCAPTLDSPLLSTNLELQLQALITEHRTDQGLSTMWDERLSYLLTPALAAYEIERNTGVTAGSEEFAHAIRFAVPDGHTFKGFPIQYLYRNPRRIFANSLKYDKCLEIINCRGDSMKLAIRVKLFVFPEDVCAVWVMYACTYRCVL